LVDRELITPAADASGAVAVDIGYAVRRAVVESLLSETMEDAARALGAQLSHPGHVALTPAERRQSDQLANLAARTRAPMLIGLREGDPDGWFGRIALGAGFPLVQADVRELTGNSQPCEAIADWLTLGVLAGSAVMVLGLDTLDASQLRRVGSMLERVDLNVPFVALDGFIEHVLDQKRSIVRFDKPSYSAAEKTALWMAAAARAGLELTEHDAHTLGASAQIGPTEIETCVTRCASLPPTGESLCRRLRRTATDMKQAPIPAAIRRVETVFGWHDLVLPEDVKAVLRSLSDHVTHSGRVMTSWGFSTRLPYGQGVAALFSGPSGTGKTMAAQIIAADLGFELFQVDLSKTVSKYIGDTEKNIDGVFDAAERQSAVLLFDEADALFAKRSEVKDAHDRHANVEVAYLLQRMEAFSGVAVLTSNLKQNIDQAFLRRLRFVVDFPFPDAADREAIWRRSFPADAPMADDIDLAFLARRLKLTGGNIQQIALHAAFAAATDGDQIRMSHVVAATRRELVKLGMFNADKTLDERAA
jgi:hypothetical protein